MILKVERIVNLLRTQNWLRNGCIWQVSAYILSFLKAEKEGADGKRSSSTTCKFKVTKSYIRPSLKGNNKQYSPTKKMKKRKEVRKEHTADKNALMQLEVFKMFLRKKKKEIHLYKHTVRVLKPTKQIIICSYYIRYI